MATGPNHVMSIAYTDSNPVMSITCLQLQRLSCTMLFYYWVMDTVPNSVMSNTFLKVYSIHINSVRTFLIIVRIVGGENQYSGLCWFTCKLLFSGKMLIIITILDSVLRPQMCVLFVWCINKIYKLLVIQLKRRNLRLNSLSIKWKQNLFSTFFAKMLKVKG